MRRPTLWESSSMKTTTWQPLITKMIVIDWSHSPCKHQTTMMNTVEAPPNRRTPKQILTKRKGPTLITTLINVKSYSLPSGKTQSSNCNQQQSSTSTRTRHLWALSRKKSQSSLLSSSSLSTRRNQLDRQSIRWRYTRIPLSTRLNYLRLRRNEATSQLVTFPNQSVCCSFLD